MTRESTVPSPTPASNTRTAGGRGWMLASSRPTRLAISHFSRQVLTNSRYFCRLSKKRKLRCGSSAVWPEATGGAGGVTAGSAGGGASNSTRRRAGARVGAARHEGADAVERVGGDAAAIAQAAGELAVVDGAAAEGRFGEPALAAEFADLLQDLLVHGESFRSERLCGRLDASEPSLARLRQVLGKMGRVGGQ